MRAGQDDQEWVPVELLLELAVVLLGAANALLGHGEAVAHKVPVYEVRRLAADVNVDPETMEKNTNEKYRVTRRSITYLNLMVSANMYPERWFPSRPRMYLTALEGKAF